MNKNPSNFKELILCSLIIICCYAGYKKFSSSTYDKSPMAGIELPDFSLPTFDNRALVSDDLRGKPYFINFFATWCKVCLQEHHELVKLSSDLTLPVYGVAVNDNERDINKLMGIYGNPYTSIATDNGSFSRNLRIMGLPTMVLVSETGQIITSHSGLMSQHIFKKKFQPYLERERR